jgi:predicted GH43/DUF377 family glycosyl hydrolase
MGLVTPTRVIRFDHHNLYPWIKNCDGVAVRFNPSIIESGDGYLLAWRHGWRGCNVYANRLDKDFNPVGPVKILDLSRNGATLGREDPRWFRHKADGKLHLMFIGVTAERRRVYTNVCFARINEQTLQTEDRFLPHYVRRNEWEKNWQFFDYQNELYAVYSIAPHCILKIESNHARLVHETPTNAPWSGGELRGGAAPVLHGGEWYSFFHGLTTHGGRRRYNVGVYKFENKPPFRITHMTPHPIELARLSDRHDNYCEVTFPGGLMRIGDQWCIATGIHDRWCELHFYPMAEVERRLVRL